MKERTSEPIKHKNKSKLIIVSIIVLLITASATFAILALLGKKNDDGTPEETTSTNQPAAPTIFYSNLTGEEVVRSGAQADGSTLSVSDAKARAAEINSAPTLCIQMPNGLDGARPHAGLQEAKIVFEAIAEAGITRFATIFQDPTTNAIGPIRSLRSYYLSWDTPFDCTVIHAGGEAGALQEVAQGYRHLSESTVYMWRTGGHWVGNRFLGYAAPNNLFSDAALLKKYNSDAGYTSSNPKVWPRLTPEQSEAQRLANAPKATDEASETSTTAEADEANNTEKPNTYESATSILFHFGNPGYNPVYTYDPNTNTYLRSYESGDKHTYYICDSGSQPKPEENCGEAHQVAASVVIAMKVNERLNPENNYRELIDTVGSGEAWVFQNGIVIPAHWEKTSKDSQIKFTDSTGTEISLAPGQTWISAIPIAYGYVKYE